LYYQIRDSPSAKRYLGEVGGRRPLYAARPRLSSAGSSALHKLRSARSKSSGEEALEPPSPMILFADLWECCPLPVIRQNLEWDFYQSLLHPLADQVSWMDPSEEYCPLLT